MVHIKHNDKEVGFLRQHWSNVCMDSVIIHLTQNIMKTQNILDSVIMQLDVVVESTNDPSSHQSSYTYNNIDLQ